MKLKPHQQRVVDEKKELGKKLTKLSAFIVSEKFSKVEEGEQDRLRRQANAMTEYLVILGDRIAAFS